MVAKKARIKLPKTENPNDRRTAAYWLDEDNAAVLTGLALQCRTLDELADTLHIHPATIKKWRAKHEKIKDAIDIGRDYADAAVVNATFVDAVHVDGPSRGLWWRYRIGPKEIALATKLYGPQAANAEGVSVEDAREKLIARLAARRPGEEEA
jgi:hypothetical protein